MNRKNQTKSKALATIRVVGLIFNCICFFFDEILYYFCMWLLRRKGKEKISDFCLKLVAHI